MKKSVYIKDFDALPPEEKSWAKLIEMGDGDMRIPEKRIYFCSILSQAKPPLGEGSFVYSTARCRMRVYAYFRFTGMFNSALGKAVQLKRAYMSNVDDVSAEKVGEPALDV
jgi:hypothetical protein